MQEGRNIRKKQSLECQLKKSNNQTLTILLQYQVLHYCLRGGRKPDSLLQIGSCKKGKLRDKSMHLAKELGKNQTKVWEE